MLRNSIHNSTNCSFQVLYARAAAPPKISGARAPGTYGRRRLRGAAGRKTLFAIDKTLADGCCEYDGIEL